MGSYGLCIKQIPKVLDQLCSVLETRESGYSFVPELLLFQIVLKIGASSEGNY